MASRKVQRYRGSKTHGCGSMKKRRGAGNRGGRGNAGSGKRGDAKKPSVWKVVKSPKTTIYATLNVAALDQHIASWVTAKKASEEGGVFVVDLKKLGYEKLLGSGSVKHKYKISGVSVTDGAVKKITAAGGEVQQ